jgi:thiamine thiazole synthase
MRETEITRAIVQAYTERFLRLVESDVVVAGAGPSGLAAAYYLAKGGLTTVVLEKKLSTGGGIWGGGMGCNVVVVENTDILDEMGIRSERRGDLYVVGAVELAAGLTYRAEQAGAHVLNLTQVEDIVVKDDVVSGVVVNSTAILMASLHVDPVCLSARKVVDATGHAAELVRILRDKLPEDVLSRHLPGPMGEKFMDVEPAEKGVVDRAGEVYPGLYVAGMSVCTAYALPRMGPIFGGMLESGRRVAAMIRHALSGKST